jgi:hypothetical protein
MISIALDFCSLQRTLASDGINPDILARCEAEVQRLERQFHESMVFLLRVSRADFDRISTCPKNVGASVCSISFLGLPEASCTRRSRRMMTRILKAYDCFSKRTL